LHLQEYDEREWRDVAREVRPDLTDEEFAAMWDEFQEQKRRKGFQ
jgi:hypothetical protein